MWPFISLLNDARVCWELSYWYAIEFFLIMRHNSCTMQSAEMICKYMLKPDELLPIPACSSSTPRRATTLSPFFLPCRRGNWGRANGERTDRLRNIVRQSSQPTDPLLSPPLPSFSLPRHAHTRTPSLQERIRHTDGVRTDAKRGSLDPLTSDRSKPFPLLLFEKRPQQSHTNMNQVPADNSI